MGQISITDLEALRGGEIRTMLVLLSIVESVKLFTTLSENLSIYAFVKDMGPSLSALVYLVLSDKGTGKGAIDQYTAAEYIATL